MAATTARSKSKASAPLPEVTGYDTDLRFYATRYRQGGRTVYAMDLSPDQVRALVPKPDPSKPTPGNRAIREPHASSFGKYIRDHEDWVIPGVILRAPAVFDFQPVQEVEGTSFGVISFPRQAANDIHILDGQHRILGFHLAEQGIANDLDRARSTLASARRQDPDGSLVAEAQARVDRLQAQRKRLAGERISLQIFVEEDTKAYKQMFFDIADNALGITASVKSRFDTRKVVNRALDTVLEHPLLQNRVDIEADRIGRGSPYLLGAKHVAEIVRTVQVGLDGRVSAIQDRTWSEAEIAKKAKVFLDMLVESFPPLKAVLLGQILPDDLRKTSKLGSVLMLRALAGAYHDLKEEHAFDDQMVESYFEKLAPHMIGSVYEGDIWMEHVAPGVFADNGMGPRGRRQDMKSLKDAITYWAIDKPKYIDAPPVPRPEITEDDDEYDEEIGAGYSKYGADVPAAV